MSDKETPGAVAQRLCEGVNDVSLNTPVDAFVSQRRFQLGRGEINEKDRVSAVADCAHDDDAAAADGGHSSLISLPSPPRALYPPDPPVKLSLTSLIHTLFLVSVSVSVHVPVSSLLPARVPELESLPTSSLPSTAFGSEKYFTSQLVEHTASPYTYISNIADMILPGWIWRHVLASSAVISTLLSASEATDYVQDAMTAIEELNSAWYSPTAGLWDNAWWNSGNALTTLADFALLRIDEANELNIGGYIRHTYIQAQKAGVQTIKSMSTNGMTSTTNCIDGHGCSSTKWQQRRSVGKRGFPGFLNEYYDDEGWWALGLIHAYDVTGDNDFLDSAIDIFKDMQTGTGSPCGGIYWSKDRSYVNAIANELYLSVAAALANRVSSDSKSDTYLKIAKSQWSWFQKSGMINSKNLINDGLDSKCKNNGLTTWSYNQGVILGGLSELAIATGDASYLDKAITIANAAIEALSNEYGILIEADRYKLRPRHCGMDGQQFKGIFIRNLGYLNELAPSDTFRDFILRNADSIWNENRNYDNKLGVAWTGPYVKATGPAHSSALDALVAAIAVW